LRELKKPPIYLKSVLKNYFTFLNPYFHFFQITFIQDCSNLGLELPEVEKNGPMNYMSSPAIGTMCTTLKWVSKYDFIFGNEEFVSSKITFIWG
jgi:hypothetical protein